MSDFDFGHTHRDNNRDASNAWKKMGEWARSVPDGELNDLWNDDEYYDDFNEADKRGKIILKILGSIFMICLSVAGVSFVVYQLAAALGFDNFSYRDSLITTFCVMFLRYADAGVMKQLR